MPTPPNSALRADLGSILRDLPAALQSLSDHIQHQAHEAWSWHPAKPSRPNAGPDPPPDLPRDQALHRLTVGIQAIEYEDHQDPHESRIYPGIIALSPDGIALADEVNRLKLNLARVLRQMDGRTEIGTVDPRTGEKGERPLREVALEAFYFRRLHHWQATRRLEILRETDTSPGTLDYVGFMWATSREVRRTSREALLEEANTNGRLLSPEELEILKRLPPHEPLAIVRPGHTTPKANIRWTPRDGAPPTTKVRIAVLPLLVPGEHLPERLRKLPPAPPPRNHRAPRTDIEIETTPVLPLLQAYRYLPQVRTRKRQQTTR